MHHCQSFTLLKYLIKGIPNGGLTTVQSQVFFSISDFL